jgi:hypothetical protein
MGLSYSGNVSSLQKGKVEDFNFWGALTFVCATLPSKEQILGISHEILQVVGFMRALQTSNGESITKYMF